VHDILFIAHVYVPDWKDSTYVKGIANKSFITHVYFD